MASLQSASCSSTVFMEWRYWDLTWEWLDESRLRYDLAIEVPVRVEAIC